MNAVDSKAAGFSLPSYPRPTNNVGNRGAVMESIAFMRRPTVAIVTVLTVATLMTPVAAQESSLRLGVLTDMSSLYADNAGQGSVVAAQMAVDDFGGKVLGRKIQIVAADHQNKADIGATIAKRWIDSENVELVLDVPNSAVALAVQGITREKKKDLYRNGRGDESVDGR
jgi:branched-chain amino acid transport system substrate-binding protein